MLKNPTENVTPEGCELLTRVLDQFLKMNNQINDLKCENQELQKENEEISEGFQCSICYHTFSEVKPLLLDCQHVI